MLAGFIFPPLHAQGQGQQRHVPVLEFAGHHRTVCAQPRRHRGNRARHRTTWFCSSKYRPRNIWVRGSLGYLSTRAQAVGLHRLHVMGQSAGRDIIHAALGILRHRCCPTAAKAVSRQRHPAAGDDGGEERPGRFSSSSFQAISMMKASAAPASAAAQMGIDVRDRAAMAPPPASARETASRRHPAHQVGPRGAGMEAEGEQRRQGRHDGARRAHRQHVGSD